MFTKHWSQTSEENDPDLSGFKEGWQRTCLWVRLGEFKVPANARCSPIIEGYSGWVKRQREPVRGTPTEQLADVSPAGNWTGSKAGVCGKMKFSVLYPPSHGPLKVLGHEGLWNVPAAVESQTEIEAVSLNWYFIRKTPNLQSLVVCYDFSHSYPSLYLQFCIIFLRS